MKIKLLFMNFGDIGRLYLLTDAAYHDFRQICKLPRTGDIVAQMIKLTPPDPERWEVKAIFISDVELTMETMRGLVAYSLDEMEAQNMIAITQSKRGVMDLDILDPVRIRSREISFLEMTFPDPFSKSQKYRLN